MKVRIFCATFALALVAAAAQPQGLVYEQDGKPLFSIELPDGWVVDLDFEDEAREAGTWQEGEELQIRIVEARPDDGSKIWVGLWGLPWVSNLDEAVEYLAGLNQDIFSEVEISRPKDTDLNGMAARTATGKAVHQGEEVEFIVALFEPRAGSIAIGMYVGAVDGWKDWEAELERMVKSLQPVN